MDTFLQLQTAVMSDLNIDSTSPLFPPTTVKLAINRAYRKAGALYRWSETEDAKKTSTVSGQDYYDYPPTWKPDSAWKLSVDGKDYGDPISFKDYLYEQENKNPSGQTRMWSTQWRRYFIDPAPTASGSNNIVVWGQKAVDTLSLDNDVTIFSYSLPECNEAIVLETVAILKNKGGEGNAILRRYIQGSQLMSIEAKQILETAWNKIQEDQAKFEKTQAFLDVPDFFGNQITNVKTTIGNF